MYYSINFRYNTEMNQNAKEHLLEQLNMSVGDQYSPKRLKHYHICVFVNLFCLLAYSKKDKFLCCKTSTNNSTNLLKGERSRQPTSSLKL